MPTKRLIRSTTVLSVRRDGNVVLAGDGQVTLGESVIKHSAQEDPPPLQRQDSGRICRLDRRCFHPVQPLRAKLEQYHGNLGRAAVELAKDWRTDKFLRHLEALLLVCDKSRPSCSADRATSSSPMAGIAAIGSGGPYAQAAARRLPSTRSSRPARSPKKP